MFVDAFSWWFSFRFPKREFIVNKALQQNLDWVVLALFLYIKQSKFICHDALKVFTLIINRSLFAVMRWRCFYLDRRKNFLCRNMMFLLWSSIKVYLPCFENVFTLIINWSLFSMIHWNYFNSDHQSKFGVANFN